MLSAQQLAAGLRAFAAAIDAPAGTAGTAAVGALQPGTVVQPAPVVQQPATATATPATATPATVTPEMLTALIQPHIGNEAVKAALGNAMRAMGINALPETQPHQFAPLYAAFQQVIAGAGAAAPAASTSII